MKCPTTHTGFIELGNGKRLPVLLVEADDGWLMRGSGGGAIKFDKTTGARRGANWNNTNTRLLIDTVKERVCAT